MAENDWTDYCVSCGRPIEVKNKIRGRHECPKSHDAAQKAANTRAYDGDPELRRPPLPDRLDEGFRMLAEDEEET